MRKIRVDSDEYRAWHEVGHATVCLHLGGDVEFIEFLNGDAPAHAHARARCIVTSEEMDKSVACAGFTAEFYLLDNRYAKQRSDDKRNINEVVFHNTTDDREGYWGRKRGEEITEDENKKFLYHALSLIPIFNQYFSVMQAVVHELCAARRVEGRRVKELLQLRVPH
jgi:hypothetical protein